MNKNVGNIDRAIRSVAGVLAILAHMLSFVSGTVGIALLIIGIIPRYGSHRLVSTLYLAGRQHLPRQNLSMTGHLRIPSVTR